MNFTPTFAPPSEAELKGRLDRVRARMAEAGLDRYVAFSPDNIYYLTNFANIVHERPFVLVISRSGPPQFVVPQLEQPHVRTRSIGELELIPYFEFPAPAGREWSDRFKALFGAGERVGVESVCPLQVYAQTPGERVCIDIIDDVRMIKSDYEIGRHVYACGIATDAHNLLLSEARPGLGMAEMSSRIRGFIMQRLLADDPTLNPLATRIVAVFQPGSVSHDPHNFSNIDMRMEEGGPHVSIVNAVMNGYGAEVERTFFLGHVPDAARRAFDVMSEGRRLAFDAAMPGALLSDVDRKVNDYFRRAGMGDRMLHRTGHGMGVTAHEAPFFAEGYDRPIEKGMCLTIEPGIYIEGVGGFRHSDTVLIGDEGPVQLTGGPLELDALTFPVWA
ncbi:M24 family metallopeptidase [Burkholderia contaminans]|uniref:Peptidase M24 n=1 Tax=Burkholderia contaminans TaxID=488447 RepID=A0A6P3BIJ8_9BURK|nr:Xaa-Pro peptidase family protein [Burkholderia contaminans]VWD55585.1 peptidase M24 [Burkholderia contaminans]